MAPILSYVSGPSLTRLWTTGDKTMQTRLTQNVRIFDTNNHNLMGTRTIVKRFTGNFFKSLAVQFPFLTELRVARNKFVDFFLPNKIRSLQQLQILDISGCDLPTLPHVLSQLTNLIELNASDNTFTHETLPDIIPSLTRLETLHVENCCLNILPPNTFSQLPHLTRLEANRNWFGNDALDNEISSARQLRVLNLSSSFLTTLPQTFSQLINLTDLDVSSNQFTNSTFLDEITSLIPLRRLIMSGCDLTTLPNSFSQLSSLTKLHISGNQFEDAALTPLISLFNLNHLKSVTLDFMDLKKSTLPRELHPYRANILGVDWENNVD